MEALESALATLPEQFRLTLSLREFAELSYEEIATVLSIRQGTVKSRLARARHMLKEQLEAMGVKP
jgi:RNA polymerase sigma-70 factor (ECF subfamily)